MSKKLRYKGGFYSRRQTSYDVEIWQEKYSGPVGEIAFCDVPLEIEWPSTDKFEPVQSSRATLQLYSDGDRQFVDLYSIQPGSVRMDVKRNGELYWSGMLDPELYEEPFSFKENYGVTLTFSDLAILDRLSWCKTGFMTVRGILEHLVEQSGIENRGLEEYVSTKLSRYDTANLLKSVSVETSNFYDEDGEAMSMRQVLEETLRPFALRLIQKNGKILIYDLNYVHTELTPEKIDWQSNDAVLGVDKVFNNVKLTFSPYEKTIMLKGEVDPDLIPKGPTCTTWMHCAAAPAEIGFETTLSKTGNGLEKCEAAHFFRMDPVYSGSKDAGIAWTVKTFRPNYLKGNYLNEASHEIGSMLFKIPDQAYIANSNGSKLQLKLNMQLLFDSRYNPFEQASINNDEGNWKEQKKRANFAYVPFMLTLRDESGTAIAHWENKKIKNGRSFNRIGECGWVDGAGSWGDAWMCWYEGNRKDESGLGGWQGNKQIIGYYLGKNLPVLFNKMDKGEYIDLPGMSGWLDLQIGTGVVIYDTDKDKDGGWINWAGKTNDKGVLWYEQCCWLLYKDLKLELVDKYGKSVETRDVEHNAWINMNAKEELKVDTILGTLKESSPTALGQLFTTSYKLVIGGFYRAGVTDQIERLLIGTLYSNYAERHHTLSGTAALLPVFGSYTDNNLPGKFLLLGETQHLVEDESEIQMVQFDADKYEGVKFYE